MVVAVSLCPKCHRSERFGPHWRVPRQINKTFFSSDGPSFEIDEYTCYHPFHNPDQVEKIGQLNSVYLAQRVEEICTYGR